MVAEEHDRPLSDRFVLTESGWREYSETAKRGVHKNSANGFGVRAFYATAEPQILSVDRKTKKCYCNGVEMTKEQLQKIESDFIAQHRAKQTGGETR